MESRAVNFKFAESLSTRKEGGYTCLRWCALGGGEKVSAGLETLAAYLNEQEGPPPYEIDEQSLLHGLPLETAVRIALEGFDFRLGKAG